MNKIPFKFKKEKEKDMYMKGRSKQSLEQESKKWTNEQLLEFYKGFNHNSFIYAALNDEEMRNYIYAVSYYRRAEMTKSLHFEKISKEVIVTTITSQFDSFIRNFEERVKTNDSSLFRYIFKDSELSQKDGIYSTEEAVYAMRDEVLGSLMNQILNRFSQNMFNRESFQEPLKELLKYNSTVHRGSKYNCYKNHILTNHFGLMVFGSSLFFQGKLEIEETYDFDSFCDKFDEYFIYIMECAGIRLNSGVMEEDFACDIKMILDALAEKNLEFFNFNYELVLMGNKVVNK